LLRVDEKYFEISKQRIEDDQKAKGDKTILK